MSKDSNINLNNGQPVSSSNPDDKQPIPVSGSVSKLGSSESAGVLVGCGEKFVIDTSLNYRDDGSLVVRHEGTTLIKTGTLAVVKGVLVKQFKENDVNNIVLTRDWFKTSMVALRKLYNVGEVGDEKVVIDTVKYIKVVKYMRTVKMTG